MRFRSLLLMLFALCISLASFASDNDADRTALLKLHTQDREGHLKGDVDLLLAGMAPSVREIRNGRVDNLDRESSRQHLAEDFKKVKYTAWDDIDEPVIQVSTDGKMAWMIARVRGEAAPVDSPERKQSFVTSWIATYEKGPSGWQMTSIAPTVGPAPDQEGLHQSPGQLQSVPQK